MTTLPCVMLSISVEALFLDEREELAAPIPLLPQREREKGAPARGIGCADPFAPAGVLAKHLAWHVRAYQLFLMLTFKQA